MSPKFHPRADHESPQPMLALEHESGPIHAWGTKAAPEVAQDAASANPGNVDVELAGVRAQLNELNQRVNSAATEGTTESASPSNAKPDIKSLVEQSFDLRQQLQRLEAQRMRLKLQAIENNIELREKSRESIVQKRLEELATKRIDLPTTLVTSIPLDHPPIEATSVLDGSAVSSARAIPAWDEPMQIKDGLIRARSSFEPTWEAIKDVSLRLTLYSTPVAEWSVNHRKEFAGDLHSMWARNAKDRHWDPDPYDSSFYHALESLKSWNTFQSPDEQNEALTLVLREPHPEVTDAMIETIRPSLASRQTELWASFKKRYPRYLLLWQEPWNAYQSRLRLLKLDVDEAAVQLESAEAYLARLEMARELTYTMSEMALARSAVSTARFRRDRAAEIMRPFADIEVQNPELNPATFKLPENLTDK